MNLAGDYAKMESQTWIAVRLSSLTFNFLIWWSYKVQSAQFSVSLIQLLLDRWPNEGRVNPPMTSSHVEKLPNTPWNPPEKCVSKAWLLDPRDPQHKQESASQRLPGPPVSAQYKTWLTAASGGSHVSIHAQTHPEINYVPLVRLNSPTACPEVTHFSLLTAFLETRALFN